MKKAKFDFKEAQQLHNQGWCWQALAGKYDYHKGTIKKYISPRLTEKGRKLHHDLHSQNCPVHSREARTNQRKLLS